MIRHQKTVRLGDTDVRISARFANVLHANQIESLPELRRLLKSGRFVKIKNVGIGVVAEAVELVKVRCEDAA